MSRSSRYVRVAPPGTKLLLRYPLSGRNVVILMTQTTQEIDPVLAGLEPLSVWKHFGQLARIPRESGNESGVRDYVTAFAGQRGISCESNEVGDVLLRVNPDAAGTVVALQAHMDMVCVASPGTAFDFGSEPIRLLRDGDFIRARGTSLGADNGIGVAYALALAEVAKGPLEVLLTVDEEQGFTGIEGVAAGWLRARTLINLDSEEEGFITIASAGARDYRVGLRAERVGTTSDITPIRVQVHGLKGGHSGIEIHRGRTNALKVLGRVLGIIRSSGGVVFGLQGGAAPNVIPSAATVSAGLPTERFGEFRASIEQLRQGLVTDEDPGLLIDIREEGESGAALVSSSVDRLVALLDELPTGVLVPSPRDPAQPFVSNNMAVIGERDGGIEVTMMSRSPSREELEQLADRYAAIAAAHGATMEAGRLVAGWAPDYDSPLLARFQRAHEKQYGKPAKILEIHAGLECGALQSKYPGIDLISVGPDITGVHSPDEKVSIPSTARVFELVRTVVDSLHDETSS